MGIHITGMASGLPPNIVEQLMEAERIPVKQMENKKLEQEDKLKLITDLESKIGEITKNLSELVGTKGFTNNKFNSGDPNIVTGTVDPENPVTGTWQVEVIQLAQRPGAVSNGFPDRDTSQLGVGYLRFGTGDEMKEVYINGTNNTLDGVVKQINASNTGMRASVINDRKDKENPFKLMVTGLATGEDNQVLFPTVYLLDGDQDMYFDNSKPAQNAKVKVDGFEFEVPENTVKDVVPGVVLDLKQSAPGREIAITVKEDLEVISGKIKSFVDAYNGVLGFIQGQAKITKTKDGKQQLGPMGGDSMLRSIESRLRGVMQNSVLGVQSSITRMNQIGIEFNRNGTLNFTAEKFNTVLQKDPAAVAAFFRGDGFNVGFVPVVKREISNLLNGTFGPISNRKRSVEEKVDRLNKNIERKEGQLEKKEEQLRKKFADLESTMSKFQSQGAAVAGMAGQKNG